ncbi:hypothetical protein [Paramagnetospirillum magneticum]|uniref:Uncharacterized protein n=1 Tax=Paramagnetospirillum magneticum (strain ATCC 700264 / AMB-1) TaxID=342108 RepID=Q2WA71_PARM1|nr:hypothetical protein [Paramagnetospirillum magneticum]BAE49254.1 hypothetical protein amb0450 [Paramagnetospirillum magneticum AMB-1]
MLSNKIEALRERLVIYRGEGLVLEPQGVDTICAMLAAFAYDARQLEQSAVSDLAKAGDDLPENVVQIATVLARKGVRVGPRPIGGGDAA